MAIVRFYWKINTPRIFPDIFVPQNIHESCEELVCMKPTYNAKAVSKIANQRG